eukprot:GHVT01043778.1.p1 GENE.GHVT01043778.1~~GHVT01043778.1.p1  ORF type:complete len:128 (+),score=6.80 GHVT01043778.1:1021-1404(+)
MKATVDYISFLGKYIFQPGIPLTLLLAVAWQCFHVTAASSVLPLVVPSVPQTNHGCEAAKKKKIPNRQSRILLASNGAAFVHAVVVVLLSAPTAYRSIQSSMWEGEHMMLNYLSKPRCLLSTIKILC